MKAGRVVVLSSTKKARHNRRTGATKLGVVKVTCTTATRPHQKSRFEGDVLGPRLCLPNLQSIICVPQSLCHAISTIDCSINVNFSAASMLTMSVHAVVETCQGPKLSDMAAAQVDVPTSAKAPSR